MKNIWKVIGRLTDHDCEISSTSDQILPAGGVWVGFHTGWTQSGHSRSLTLGADAAYLPDTRRAGTRNRSHEQQQLPLRPAERAAPEIKPLGKTAGKIRLA